MRANFQSPPDNIFLSQIPLNILTDAPKTTASIGGGTVRTSASGTPSRSGACPAGIAQHVEPPPRNIIGVELRRSIRTRFLAAKPPSGLRRFGKTKPRTRNRNPGPPSPPRRGGAARIPAIRPRTKRLLPNEKSQSPRTTGRGCPDDLQAAPPIRLSGRNLTEIWRQRLRYISS